MANYQFLIEIDPADLGLGIELEQIRFGIPAAVTDTHMVEPVSFEEVCKMPEHERKAAMYICKLLESEEDN